MLKGNFSAQWIGCTGLLLLLLLASAQLALAADEEILFLHHSTGRNVYLEGDVPEWISDYNNANGTNYQIQERSYPTGSYPWHNYPYDYWNLWINGACDSSDPDIECLDSMAADYDVIIFKHCFPGSDIVAGTGTGSVDSRTKTLENYKLQYRALRDLMDTFTDTIFIVWTLPPRHRLATNADNAARAAQFVNWVKNNFLTEDGQAHPNIFIFDFWGIVAEQDPNPPNGEVNCLKYEFERSHSSSDSHPNTLANETAGPLFAERIVNVIESFQTGNAAPTADAGGNQKVSEGELVTLDGSGSHDPDGNIAGYAWVQISGATAALSSPNSARASFTAPEVGESDETLEFDLTVTDSEGLSDTDTCQVLVETGEPPDPNDPQESNGGSGGCLLLLLSD
ncbi:MAG: PKD domain-containing protein [Desulfobacterales bacterium]|nr:PKD domain-containing protein [Desulfobacterales bacterium]